MAVGVARQCHRPFHTGLDVVDPHRRLRRQRLLGGLGEVEGVRPHHHGAAAGGGLDQVLAAQRRKAAAQQRHVGAGEIQRHLAHRITQPNIGCGGLRQRLVGPLAAPQHHQALHAHQRLDRVKTLRMARHQQQQRARRRLVQPSRQQRALFALTGAGGQHHRPIQALAPLPADRHQPRRGVHVEFQVAADHHGRGASRAQALGIVLRLRQHQRQARRGRVHQRGQAPALGRAARAEPGVGHHHRHAGTLGLAHQVGPQLGFHQHPDRRPKVMQEAPRCARCVVGQPDLAITGQHQPAPGSTPGGRAVGQQQAQFGVGGAQRFDQRHRGTGFAQRHRMQPQGTGQRAGAGVKTQALEQAQPIARLGAATPPQPQQVQRRDQPQHAGIGQPGQTLPGLLHQRHGGVTVIAGGLSAPPAKPGHRA